MQYLTCSMFQRFWQDTTSPGAAENAEQNCSTRSVLTSAFQVPYTIWFSLEHGTNGIFFCNFLSLSITN